MKIIITGVAGFLGSNLAERLLKEGHEVTGIDNLSHGLLGNLDFRPDTNFDFYLADVCDFRILDKHDIIIHFASEKIPRYSDSFDTIDINQRMMQNIVDMAVRTNAKVIFASTSDVYGKNKTFPFKEDSEFVLGNTDVKRWAYATSKIHGEHLLVGCHDKYGIDYNILRFFSCYGRRQALGWWGGVQSAFIDSIISGQDIEIHGMGTQQRCFTYIDDALDGIVACINNDEANNKIFNIGNPHEPVTIYRLAKLLFEIMDKTVNINYKSYEELGKYEDAYVKIPDITKAQNILGFEPKWTLKDGLTETIKWKLKQMNNGRK